MAGVRRWFYDHGIRWHAQNLDAKKKMWRQGRAWLNLFKGNGETGVGYAELLEIHPSWHLGEKRLVFHFAFDCGTDGLTRTLGLTVAIPYARFWIEFEGALADRFIRSVPLREIAFRYHDGRLRWALWTDPHDPPMVIRSWRYGVLDSSGVRL